MGSGNLIFFDLNRKDTQVFAVGYPNGGPALTQYAFPSGTLDNAITGISRTPASPAPTSTLGGPTNTS